MGRLKDQLTEVLRRLRLEAARERDEAAAAFDGLADQPPGRQVTLVRSARKYWSVAFVEKVLDAVRDQWGQDLRHARHLAEMAVHAADRLSDEQYGKAHVRDYQARSRIMLAISHRRLSDLTASEGALAAAREFLTQGSSDPYEKARYEYALGHLRLCQGLYASAHEHFDEAIRIYLQLGDRHEAGRVMVDLGLMHSDAGRPHEAIVTELAAFRLLDWEREPRLVLAVSHNVALSLLEADMVDLAREVLSRTRPMYRLFGRRSEDLRRIWLEGSTLLKLGRLQEAESWLLEARSGFIELEAAVEVAKVSLELAWIYAGQGKASELHHLSEEMAWIFGAAGVDREKLAALAFFRHAVAAETGRDSPQ